MCEKKIDINVNLWLIFPCKFQLDIYIYHNMYTFLFVTFKRELIWKHKNNEQQVIKSPFMS
jgi:hypothetical protein